MYYENMNILIRDVQLVQLNILLEFDRICKKNNLRYQLFAGTLLGAVRHKGFIPWDDDIDVCMLREDYEKFLEISTTEINSKYFVQNKDTDENTYLQFTKIRKNNTLFSNNIYNNSDAHNGIFIDVFPLDNVEVKSWKGKAQPFLFNALYKINSSRFKNKAIFAKSKVNRSGRMFLFYFLKLVPKYKVDQLIGKVLNVYNAKECSYVNHFTNGIDKKRFDKYLMKRSDFDDVIYQEYEGYLFPIPRNYDQVLKRLFGNYFELPEPENRFPHHGINRISFDVSKESTNDKEI